MQYASEGEGHPFHPHPTAAVPPAPAGTCDAQFHVFESRDQAPVAPDAAYHMPEATIESALRMHRAVGIQRGVIVQPTTYGIDHQVLLRALRRAGSEYVGCAILAEGMDAAMLDRLHEGGVRGCRFNFFDRLNIVPDPDSFRRYAWAAADRGWFVKLNVVDYDLADLARSLSGIPVQIVVDHMGSVPVDPSLSRERRVAVLRCLERENWWMMLSNGYRLSVEGPPWQDAVTLAQEYLLTAPERCVWGSDWPHPLSATPPPDDGRLLELAYRYAGDIVTTAQLLVDNPRRLFGFSAGPDAPRSDEARR